MDMKLFLSQIADILFYPVLLLLVLLVAWMLIACGMFARSLLTRMRGKRPARETYFARIESAATGDPSDAELHIEDLLHQADLEMVRRLNMTRFAIRVGPSLGLIGTLIPMAIALGGLANGDLPSLAANMVTAFSSTIVGIAIGIVAYMLTLVRDGWVRSDMNAIRARAERALRALEDAA